MENTEDYIQEKLTIDLIRANIYSLLIALPLGLIYGIPYGLIWHNQFTLDNLKEIVVRLDHNHDMNPVVVLIVFFVVFTIGIIAHELIHGIVWAVYAKNGFKSIKFGVMWKMLTPYCHCKEALTIKQYVIGAIMPAIILGFLPAIYGIVIGNIGWLLFGLMFSIAASGDFMIVWLLRKENMNDYVQDHPTEAGCYVYRKKAKNIQ